MFGPTVHVQAAEFGPQSAVRRFCQADGLGQRVSVAGWPQIAPLVNWSFEPAWDYAVLIASYEVGSPVSVEDVGITVDVHYTVIGQVSALGFETAVHIENVTFQVEFANGNWRLVGPPPPPHIFANRVDIESMLASLELGGLNFVSDTLFVWKMFQSAGWNVTFVPTADLLNGTVYRAVDAPKVGDLVIYLRDGVPYHVGMLEADDQVVSSTLNAGIVRTPANAFPGEVKYLRLVQPEPGVEATPVPSPEVRSDTAPATPARTATIQRRRTPTPKVTRTKRRAAKSTRARAQHPGRKRVKLKRGKQPKHATPIARNKVP